MTISEDAAVFLAGKGLGTLGTNIAPEFRDAPDDLLVVREYPGGPPTHAKTGPPAFRRPRFQVTCRSKDVRAATMRAEDAFRHLSGFSGVINGTAYASIRALGDPAPIGRDDAGRERVVVNFEVIM